MKKAKQVLLYILGGIVFVTIVLIGWLPPKCPLLRGWIIGCPINNPHEKVLTPEEVELKRFPHQRVTTNTASFQTDAEENRTKTRVDFYYRGPTDKSTAILKVKAQGFYKDISLITHPLLTNIEWPNIASGNSRLYQQNQDYSSIENLLSNLPNPKEIAVDTVIAKAFSLRSDQYTPLETLTSLSGVKYIFTSYTHPYKDRTWLGYNHVFDIQDADIDEKKQINWMISFSGEDISENNSFLLSTVHINYLK